MSYFFLLIVRASHFPTLGKNSPQSHLINIQENVPETVLNTYEDILTTSP